MKEVGGFDPEMKQLLISRVLVIKGGLKHNRQVQTL